MQKNLRVVLFLLIGAFLLSLTACNKELRTYNTYSRKGNVSQRDSAAFYFYKRGAYEKAGFLFEELMRLSRGGNRGPEYLYHYAYSKYKQGLFIAASFYFDQFTQQYSNHAYMEECAFMKAYCFYQQADPYYLDQTYTNKAMEEFQVFVNLYPLSNKVTEANDLTQDLRERIALKEYEQAKLYLKIENYKAATEAFAVFMQQYPDSRYREESHFLKVESALKLAEVSIERRKRNRYLDAISFYERFVSRYPNSTYLKEAESFFDKAQRYLTRNPDSK